MEEENLSGKEKKKGFTIFKKKEIWISGIIGILIGGALIYLLGIFGVPGLGNETVATMKGKNLTKNILYEDMKKIYPIDYVLERSIDRLILDKKYTLTEEQKQEINDEYNNMIEYYEELGYTEEDVLSNYGYQAKEKYIADAEDNYKLYLYYMDYFKTLIPQEEIEAYYNNNEIYGEINTRHILVKLSDNLTEKEALDKANEIIAKLDEGTSFDDVITEYVDKSTIITEKVDFNWFDANLLAEEYVTAAKKLEKGTYTKEAILTNFGYHIIYCVNKAEKPTIEEAENDIVDILSQDIQAEDQDIRYKALIKLREDSGLKFKDEKYKEEYKEYCDEINGVE